MRAIVITEAGGPEVLRLQERPKPVPEREEILVRVRASALNRADLLQRRGRYPAPPGAPQDVPGIEFVGEVEAVGPAAGLWGVGSRVMGITAGGGHAEYLRIPEREAIRVPTQLSWEEAAAIPEVFITAYDALFRQLEVRAEERVLIHAVGSGVGTAALQLARVAGAHVIGTSRTAVKLRHAAALGLETGIDSSREDWPARVMEETGGAGVNAIVELVGGHLVAEDLRVLAPLGRLLVVGTMAGSRADVDLRTLMTKRLRVSGTVLRSRGSAEKIGLAREFSTDVLPHFASGAVRPVIDSVFSFADVAEAHRRLEQNETFGKIVLVWD